MSMPKEMLEDLKKYQDEKPIIEAILAGYGHMIEPAPPTRAATLKSWSKGDKYDLATSALLTSIKCRKNLAGSYSDGEGGHAFRVQLEERLLADLEATKVAGLALIKQQKKLNAMDTTTDVAGFPGTPAPPPKLQGVWAAKK